VTKPGGFLVLCDLHCGDGPDVSAEELHTFAETNMVIDVMPCGRVLLGAGPSSDTPRKPDGAALQSFERRMGLRALVEDGN
jgi:hypothetical protein